MRSSSVSGKLAGQGDFPFPIMDANSLPLLKDQKEKPQILAEVANVEKQLRASILTKGPLNSDVQALYQRVCSSYEKLILNDHELVELQDVEHSLWKLHYLHICEFRKRTKKSPSIEEDTKFWAPENVVASQGSSNIHLKGFKSFLSQATNYYQNLIIKIKSYHGLPEDFSFCRSGGTSVSFEPKKMQKIQFLCHCFLVCLGDLTRYTEQCEKSDVQKQNWSVAVTHYVEATKIWPHSGNPHNRLAVLAMYVGDEFLALYHCIRSLAVREPFPDARDNLNYLFERNRSSHLQFLSNEARFDFLNLSESSAGPNSQSSNDFSNCKIVLSEFDGLRETNLWPLFIRTMSFFFIKSSWQDFPFTFASTVKELDMLMALDDEKLKAAIESYLRVDSARSGPFRTLQFVSIFIYAIENLIHSPERSDLKNKNDTQQFELTQEALSATFTFMGHLTNRCLKAKFLNSCPLLPALLVFSEWLVSILDEVETHELNKKSKSAMSYFFGAFLELVKHFDTNKDEVKPPGSMALWEDYELRGFAPLSCLHSSLDFSIHWGHTDNYESGSECRAERIIYAAIKIAARSNNKQKWIYYDQSGRKFYAAESNEVLYRKEEEAEAADIVDEVKESGLHIQKMIEESERIEEKPINSHVIKKPVVIEEEEVILFKPLTRYNSAPLYSAVRANDESTQEDTLDHIVPADECLRRATSLLIAQNQAKGDPLSFHSDLTNFGRNKVFQQQEHAVDVAAQTYSEASIYSAPFSFNTFVSGGPPSLNAWVLDKGNLTNDRVNGKREMNKHSMPPIEQIASASLNDLSINDSATPVISSGHESVISHYTHPAYAAPVPSAPLLPDDAVWFNGVQSTNYNSSGNTNRINVFDASRVGGYSNWTGSHQPLDYGLGTTNFMDGCTPMCQMTSSEWLRQYRENQNLYRNQNHLWPEHSYIAVNTGNFYSHDMSRSGLFDQCGVPLAACPLFYQESPQLHLGFPPLYGSGTVQHRREKLYHGYQRPSPYGCGAVNEPEPLL